MGTHFHTLPPLKRFRFLQKQQEQHPRNKENVSPSSMPSTQLLPAKKRIESRNQPLPFPPPPVALAYSLPTKKRVWAFQPPDLDDEIEEEADSGKQSQPLLPLDLNVIYDHCFDYGEKEDSKNENNQKKKKKQTVCSNKVPPLSISSPLSIESSQSDGGDEIDLDDDGILCAVCLSTDGDPSDPIVFCDGCDLMVHTTCYGNPLVKGVPEGDWFCEECSVCNDHNGKLAPLPCCLCPNKGGGLKSTRRDGKWAHIVCALLIPEVFFEDPDGREGINVSKVPKRRWQQKCYLCKSRKGCVIECSEPKCPMAFHITCGLKEDLSIEYNQGSKSKETIVAGFCRIHTDQWQQQTGKFKIVARG
ncbi:Protein Jade-1 [Linum perenne]